jgi:hypothetical protein
MADAFANSADAVDAPATQSFAIQPDDVVPLPILPKGIYVGRGGDLALQGSRDTAPVIWRNVPGGALIPFRAMLIPATGTTAGDLVGIA